MCVVFYHFNEAVGRTTSVQWAPQILTSLFRHGGLGVDIFFVISGFVIAMSTRNGAYSLSYFGRFVARRVIRLDPPYWTAIVLEIVLIAVSVRLGLSDSTMPGVAQILSHFVYLQEILGYGNIIPLFWTLCYEVQFYLFFILLLVVWQRVRVFVPERARLLLITTTLGALFLLSLLFRFAGISTHGFALHRWYQFFIGVLVFWSLAGYVKHWPWIIADAILIGAVAYWSAGIWQVLPVVVSAFLVYTASRRQLERRFGGPTLQFFGRISYSLYLFHGPIGERVVPVLARLHGSQVGWMYAWFEFLVALAVSVAFAYGMWWVLERPSINLSKQIRLPKAIQA